MASQQSTSAASGATVSSTALQTAATDLVVADFSAWPGENRLGEYADAGRFENGDGAGVVEDGRLRLEYDDAGWLLLNVRQDVSDYDALEIDVAGDEGGEAEGVQLEVGSVEGPLEDLAEGSIGTELSTLTVDLEAAGVDASSLQDVWLEFWRAGNGAVEIEEVRFVGSEDLCIVPFDGYEVCSVRDDELYRDFNGDGSVTQADVTEFFTVQHQEGVQTRPERFDFNGNGDVGLDDVVYLFTQL